MFRIQPIKWHGMIIPNHVADLQNISKKWTMPIRNWGAALSRFAIVFEGRVPIY